MKPAQVNVLRAVAVSLVALVVSVSSFKPAGELAAVLIRRHWPNAWFSGLIVWYADFFAFALSIAIAFFVGRHTLNIKTKAVGYAIVAAFSTLVVSFSIFRWGFIQYWQWQHQGRKMVFVIGPEINAAGLAVVLSIIVLLLSLRGSTRHRSI
jgi:hypothetical protein